VLGVVPPPMSSRIGNGLFGATIAGVGVTGIAVVIH
jgi:hypothetical protein